MKPVKYKSLNKTLSQDTHAVVVFLCTPRCGTQWISKNISELYSDEAMALHEPLDNEYNLKENLGNYDSSAKAMDSELVAKHLDFVAEVTNNMKYIEVGWQSIGGVVDFYQRFPDRLKVIHLYRNPVKVAASLVTHNWYTGKVKSRFKKAELTPFDKGAYLSEYQERWNSLNLFEKSLYFWTEINLRILEIKHRYPQIPFFSLQFEDLFKGDKERQRITLIEMLSFIGLTYDDKMLEALEENHDRYRSTTSRNIDWKDIFNHPQTIALGEKLGYTFDDEINLSRYKDPLPRIALYKIKSFLKKVAEREN